MSQVSLPDWKVRQIKIDSKKRLEWHELKMNESLQEIGKHLRQIKAEGDYKEEYGSFENYCLQRWKMSRARAYQLVDAENTRLALADEVKDDPELSTIVDELRESHLRVVTQVIPEKRVEVIQEAKKQNKLSGTGLAEVAEQTNSIKKDRIQRKVSATKQKQICPYCSKSFETLK